MQPAPVLLQLKLEQRFFHSSGTLNYMQYNLNVI